MAKDPAFLFYTGDFSTGTQFFTDEQLGKYIRLLMAQHQLGHLEEKHMLIICKSYDKDVFSKFDKDEQGLYFNKRLENEIVKRKKYSESRSKNRKSENDISKSYDSHMENKDIVITTHSNNNSMTEIFFTDLPNSSQFESIAGSLKISKIYLTSFIPDFRKTNSMEYKNFNLFCDHFKRFVRKQLEQTSTDQPKVILKGVPKR